LSICGGSGSEYVTTFTAPADGELNVEWQSPGRDAVLYARTDCGSTGTQLQCSLADLAGLPAYLTLELDEGEEIFVIFDSESGPGVGVTGTATVRFLPFAIEACNENGVLDPDETGLDCGGPFCAPCPEGALCDYSGDCDSRACVDAECSLATHCMDAELNADETDTDCGGASCPSCFVGQSCSLDDDCESRLCGGDGICDFSTCGDGEIGGQESDIDCGGPFCELCNTGESCFDSSDCVSGFCDDSVCEIP
jgi:hypothetical protein